MEGGRVRYRKPVGNESTESPCFSFNRYLRDFMTQEALGRIKGLEDDDLFLIFDADEIPKKEVIRNI